MIITSSYKLHDIRQATIEIISKHSASKNPMLNSKTQVVKANEIAPRVVAIITLL